MDIREVAYEAAVGAYNQIGPLGPRVIADAVAVAVLREVLSFTGYYATSRRIPVEVVESMLAAFTPAEPPQQETKIMRAPTTEADTVADPRADLVTKFDEADVRWLTYAALEADQDGRLRIAEALRGLLAQEQLYWEFVKRTAADVAKWPAWKRGR